MMGEKRFYVYGFYNSQWGDIFYIGKGTGNRINDLRNRNIHVQSILANYDVIRFIILDNLTEKEALSAEKSLKESLVLQGKPIIDYEHSNGAFYQRKGIAKAKAEGKYKGRKPIEIDNDTFNAEYGRYMAREITKTELAKRLNVSRPTLDKIIKKYH